ncbi:MAG TPA: hypothetical protein VHZ55_27470 [Bryobacteraceae bacterium]|nr:hypothetical protein [Bryobacteraceae bacterium]
MSTYSKAKALARRVTNPIREAKERRQKEGLYTAVHGNIDSELHIREAADWLKRAQDFGTDRGVSYGTEFGAGFLPSYPETTGYIIGTFLTLADYYHDPSFRERAVAMGEWESAIQLDSGAVMGGMFNADPTPAIFNTGMVLLGWSALLDAAAQEQFRVSGDRASRWLVEMQEPDGNWIRGNSQFANAASTVYNVKAAWGLASMAKALNNRKYLEAATRNAEFAISRQLPNGWFAQCCLEDPQRPLLHTIAYTMQGLVGIGKITGREDFIAAAERTANSLMRLMDLNGFIPGTIANDFSGASTWCCLTGTAQTSIVWSRLAQLRNNSSFVEAAERANRYLMQRHDITSDNPSLRGGLAGSWPVHGQYGRYKILNWATKFFIDALLMRKNRGAAKYLA